MKHVKKVLCLILALAMVFVLAAPAFAAGDDSDDEGIEPYAYSCPVCKAVLSHQDIATGNRRTVTYSNGCNYKSSSHNHTQSEVNTWDICSKCGYKAITRTYWRDVCPYA